MRRFLVNYIERHRHPLNQLLHLFGLPITFLVPLVFLVRFEPMWAIASFLLGYAFQFAGHGIEGNDAGEMILVKKLLGKPYVAIVPRPKGPKTAE